MNELIRIHPDDMVAVALQPLAAGTALEVEGIPVSAIIDYAQPLGGVEQIKGEPLEELLSQNSRQLLGV